MHCFLVHIDELILFCIKLFKIYGMQYLLELGSKTERHSKKKSKDTKMTIVL